MQGFLAFPLCLPGTAVWRGRRGRLYILSVLERAAGRSKAAMQVCSGWKLQYMPNTPAAICSSSQASFYPRPCAVIMASQCMVLTP